MNALNIVLLTLLAFIGGALIMRGPAAEPVHPTPAAVSSTVERAPASRPARARRAAVKPLPKAEADAWLARNRSTTKVVNGRRVPRT